MANPLRQSILAADRANSRLKTFFSQAGIDGHPRGSIVTAYRVAKKSMVSALNDPIPLASARDVLDTLRHTLRGAVNDTLTEAQNYGLDTAGRMLSYYDQTDQDPSYSLDLLSKVQTATAAIMAVADAQASTIQAMILAGIEPEMITGTDERQGVMKSGDVLAGLAYWTASLLWDAWTGHVTRAGKGRPFRKQAVAALDNRTTDCCLRVHGQIQDLDNPFELTGTPRYADHLDGPPFHGYCRTSTVLYIASFDDGLTAEMQDGADTILAEREKGIRKERHPANAFIE